MIKTWPRTVRFPALVSIIILVVGFPVPAGAGSIDHPTAGLGRGGWSLDAEWGLSSRDVKFEDQEIEERSRRTMGRIGLGLFSHLDVFGVAGLNQTRDDAGFRGDFRPAFGGGVKLRLFQWEGMVFGMTGQAVRYRSRDSNVGGIPGYAFDTRWMEYDAALGASTRIAESSFYGAALYSTVDGRIEAAFPDGTKGKANFKELHSLGLVLGGDADILSHFRLGFELRLINETSVSTRLSFVFGKERSGP